MGFGGGGGFNPSRNVVDGKFVVTGSAEISGSLLVSGSSAGAVDLFSVESYLPEGSNDPAFTINQNADGRWYMSVGTSAQTTYACSWNISNGANSTLYLSNGNLFLASGVNLIISNPTIPANSTSAGTTGQISWGDDGGTHYIYVCVAGGGHGAATWKRVAVSTW